MNNENKPSLRFANYTDAWEQRKLGELGDTYNGLSGKTKEDFGHGNATFVTYVNVFNNSIADLSMTEAIEIDDKQNCVQYGDILFTISSETSTDVGMSSVWLGNDENVYLNSFCFGYRLFVDIELYYLAFMLRTNTVRKQFMLLAQGISRYNISKKKVMEMYVPIPYKQEQTAIGTFFQSLDYLIALLQREYDKFVKLKSAMLYKLFPKLGKSKPDIRLNSFSSEWKKGKIGSCFDERVESMPDGELLSVTIKNGIKKFSELDRNDNSNEDKTKYKKVCVGDIAYNSMRMWQGASGYSPFEGIVSPAYTVLKPKDGIDSRFFAYLFKRKDIVHVFQLNSQGITSDNWNLKFPEFKKIEFYFPESYEEQVAISTYLVSLDKVIELQNKKIEKLKNIKQALLDKMFV